jgi:hypothetical protein
VFTCWVTIPGMDDEDIPHTVVAGDGEDVDGGANEDAPARLKMVALRGLLCTSRTVALRGLLYTSRTVAL